MKTTTKKLFLFVLVLTMLLAAAGCGQGETPTAEEPPTQEPETEETAAEEPTAAEPTAEEQTEDEVVELVFMRFAEGSDVELDLMEEFNQAHPNIHVSADTVPAEDTYSKLTLTTESETPPDVFMTYWTTGAATNNLAMDLSPFIEEEGEEWFNGLSENGWLFHEWAGNYYAVPWRVSPGMAIMNKNLLEKAGLEAPAGEWTWEEFLDYAKTMTNPDDDEYGLCLIGSAEDPGTDYQFYPFLFQAGGRMINDQGLSAFDSEAGAEALQFMTDMINEENVTPPGTTSATANTCIDLLAADRVGIYINASLWLGIIRSSYPDANVTIAPLPANERASTLVGGTGLGMSSQTEHPQEAWEFIKFMTSEEPMRRWANALGFTPPNISLLEDPEFTEDPERAVIAYSIQNQKMFPLAHYPDNFNLESILRSYIQSAYLQEMTPEEALAGAASEWDSVLKEYQEQEWWDAWMSD